MPSKTFKFKLATEQKSRTENKADSLWSDTSWAEKIFSCKKFYPPEITRYQQVPNQYLNLNFSKLIMSAAREHVKWFKWFC